MRSKGNPMKQLFALIASLGILIGALGVSTAVVAQDKAADKAAPPAATAPAPASTAPAPAPAADAKAEPPKAAPSLRLTRQHTFRRAERRNVTESMIFSIRCTPRPPLRRSLT